MRARRVVVSVVSAGIFGMAACAHPPSSGDTVAAPKAAPIQSPRMLPGAPPRISSPGRFNARMEVLIRADGSPDMTTFQIIGSMSAGTTADLRSWIAQSLFAPAKQAGVAVPAVFKLEMRTQ